MDMDENRIQHTADLFASVCREAGFWMSADNRIGEQDAARLLGWSPDSLRNARSAGTGPTSYRIGGGGHRVTYRIEDLAAFIESQREE